MCWEILNSSLIHCKLLVLLKIKFFRTENTFHWHIIFNFDARMIFVQLLMLCNTIFLSKSTLWQTRSRHWTVLHSERCIMLIKKYWQILAICYHLIITSKHDVLLFKQPCWPEKVSLSLKLSICHYIFTYSIAKYFLSIFSWLKHTCYAVCCNILHCFQKDF